MKAGYAALLGMVVAYSAYQGTGSSTSTSSQQESRSSRDSEIATESIRPDDSRAAERFPTINGGICPLTVDGGRKGPCGDCKAICPAKELNGLIEDYFRAESGSDKEYLATHWSVPHAEQQNIQFVFASLPDPVHTRMALLFDRSIETIESAAQASGFLFSRAWMPWDISTHVESTDFTVRLAQMKLRERVESLPGLMIFRRSGAQGSAATVQFVFVVGETPTGGLHVEQFQNALSIRQSILASADPLLPEVKILRIYGPAFSGSLQSLDAILNSQPDDRFSRIIVRSGSVSSKRAVEDFCESTLEESQRRPAKSRPDFATFQFSDAYQEYYLGEFFRAREHLHSHVAVLSEDETAFGNQEAKSEVQKSEPANKLPDLCREEPPQPVFPFERLYFPREIAQLRDAYQRNLKIQTNPGGGKNEQNGLALSLSVTGNDDDSVAPYSPLQTPLSQESILQGIVVALRKEHAKVVTIRGTDPLDVIFLSRYLRQNYPQARLVTVGADLLMIHDFFDSRFHGILAVTSYPLLTGAEFPSWDNPSSVKEKNRLHRLFPDSYSVGDFNAFLSLIAPGTDRVGECLPGAGYAQFGLPAFLQPKEPASESEPWRAHLWLTAVGRDGYWPVAVLDDTSEATADEGRRPNPSIRAVDAGFRPTTPYSVHFTVGWTIFWILSFGSTIFLAILVAYPNAFSRSEILGRFGGGASRERNYLLFTGSLLLLGAQTIFVFPDIVWLGRFATFEGGQRFFQNLTEALNGMWLVMLCYLVSAVALGAACYHGFKARASETLARAGVIICIAAAVVTLSLICWQWPGKLDPSLSSFVYRYVHVGSGVSPLLPLLFLLAAWTWWCWQSLTGVTSTKEKHMALPNVADFDDVLPACENAPGRKLVVDAADRVRLKALGARTGEWPWETLGSMPFSKKMAIAALVGLLVILLLMRPGEIAQAFESTAYKLMYWILLYSCLLLVCYLAAQIIALWIDFRTLLQAIERVPFRRGFGDLKSLTWKPLWKLAGNGRQEFVQLLGGEVDALKNIRNGGDTNDRLDQAIQNATESRNDVSAAYEPIVDGNPKAAGDVQGLFHKLQDLLAKCASEALIYATDQWKAEEYVPPETKRDKDNDATVEPPAEDPTMRAVEYFLCLFYLNVILVPLRRLQTLILALAGVFVFVLISYSSYPFESRESFHVLLISIFFGISLIVGIVYGQMYANPLLSRITNTNPGELGLDFWIRLGTFVFVPLLSLLSVQFPEINNFLFSWLQPALQSIK